MRTWIRVFLCLLTLLPIGLGSAQAQQCTAEAARAVVDDAGRVLRRLHEENQPRIEAGFRKLQAARGWSDDEYFIKASELLTDARAEALDAKAGELLARLDRLAEVASNAPGDCARLADLEAAALELQAAVRAKQQHTLARLDSALGRTATPPATPPAARDVTASAEPPPAAPKARPADPAPERRPPPVAAPPPPAKAQPKGWSTRTFEEKGLPSPPAPQATLQPPQEPVPRPPTAAEAQPAGPTANEFSIEEIREVSRGFFGTLSTELAGVIEYAFRQSGRPTGYVLGNEGGGAFIAGVRYGRGTLYTRGGGAREVFWHGPSIGYDFGASGAKTLFLVYGLADPLDIFAGFSGVEGSAYLVGGVGLTLLTNGSLVLAPIRTGIGLRLGASIGYVRFTPRATWNPF
jgi:hypothetical protein